MKVILLELNEVPDKVFRKYIGTKLSGKYLSTYHKTISLDQGHLSPWITWSTVHRGVTNIEHKLNDINQDSSYADKFYPTIFQECIDKGLSVGLVNTMHSGRLAEIKSKQFDFLIPEAFSSNSFCKPLSLEPFQKFNLSMSRKSSRVVSNEIPKDINFFAVIFSYFRNTSRLRGVKLIFKQLISEFFKPYKKVRRRTIQSDLIFDLFYSLLKKKKSDLSVFFTNHVASSMHRFWEATFPEDYSQQVADTKWLKTYKNEISLSMKNSQDYINNLVQFVDNQNNFQLWIISSMGQKSVENYKPQTFFWDISDMNAFVSSCLKKKVLIKVLPQMIPIYSFKSDKNTIDQFNSFINKAINIKLRGKTDSTIAFSINNQESMLNLNGIFFKPEGLVKRKIDENTSSAAYHMPEGIFLRYGPDLEDINQAFLDDEGLVKTHFIKKILEDTLEI